VIKNPGTLANWVENAWPASFFKGLTELSLFISLMRQREEKGCVFLLVKSEELKITAGANL
jgi:hypothetical protein